MIIDEDRTQDTEHAHGHNAADLLSEDQEQGDERNGYNDVVMILRSPPKST